MKRLKTLRKAAGMTTAELAARIGVVPSTITNWETGIREPNIEKLIMLAEIFGCTVDELLGITKTPADPRT